MAETSLNKIKSINGGNLKMIALFCMTLDHLAVTLAEPLVIYLFAGKRTEVAIGMMIVGLMRCIGRELF